jgi:hypothetical protein
MDEKTCVVDGVTYRSVVHYWTWIGEDGPGICEGCAAESEDETGDLCERLGRCFGIGDDNEYDIIWVKK